MGSEDKVSTLLSRMFGRALAEAAPHHPRPWWYRVALKVAPGRCREIPEAQNPDRIVLRQVALVKNRRELQLHCLAKLKAATELGHEPYLHQRVRIVFWRGACWLAHACNVYLQQFASDEDPNFMHSHPYKRMFALGFWGAYTEHRIAGISRRRKAPYAYSMDGGHVHHVQEVTPGHTSIFIGLGRAIDGTIGDKHYYGVPEAIQCTEAHDVVGCSPRTRRKIWSSHIKAMVKRI